MTWIFPPGARNWSNRPEILISAWSSPRLSEAFTVERRKPPPRQLWQSAKRALVAKAIFASVRRQIVWRAHLSFRLLTIEGPRHLVSASNRPVSCNRHFQRPGTLTTRKPDLEFC